MTNIRRLSQCVCFLGILLMATWSVMGIMKNLPDRGVNAASGLGDTLYVGGSGVGNYTWIQDAIDNASTGDTIYVYSGTYVENVAIDKAVALRGENEATTVIDAGGTGDGVTISAGQVTLSFFTVQNAGGTGRGAGISVFSSNVTLTNCTSSLNDRYGILLKNCSQITLVNCTSFSNHLAGIALQNVSHSNINGCQSFDHQGLNLSLPRERSFNGKRGEVPLGWIHIISGLVYYKNTSFPAMSVNVTARDDNTSAAHHWDLTESDGRYTITFSTFQNDTYYNGDHLTIWANATGIFSGWRGITEDYINESQIPQYIEDIFLEWTGGTGILLVNSHNNSLTNCRGYNNDVAVGMDTSWDNTLTQCQGYNNTQGISLMVSKGNNINDCDLHGNVHGVIFAVNTSGNTVTGSQVYDNEEGVTMYQSSDNLVYNNVFENLVNAVDDGTNQWNITKTGGVNIINYSYLGGNYWDDYLGGDNNGDGLGDTYLPHTSSGGITMGGDYCPLTAPNNAPVARDDFVTVIEDSTNNIIDALANDTDPDNHTLAIVTITNPLHGFATNNNTYITYTPTPDYYGTDTINYTISDGNTTDTATIHITIVQVSEPPVALDDFVTIMEDSTNNIIDALANDTDPENDTLYIISIIQPIHGFATNNNTYITYTPTPDYYGTDTINYTISDGNTTDTATIHITIIGINDPPSAENDFVTVMEDSTNNIIDALANDTDPENDTLYILSIIQPSYGTAINNHTHIIYSPNPNYAGNDIIIYTITDGDRTDIGTISIVIIGVNDPPIANFTYTPLDPTVDDVIQFTDTSIEIDPDGTLTAWFWEFGDGGTANGQNPLHGYGGAGTYQVNLTVWDNQGTIGTTSRNVIVDLPTLDYIIITHSAGNEILDDTISTGLSLSLYAVGYNYTHGLIGLINATWGIVNSGSNAFLNVTHGFSVTMNSGWLNGTATIEVTDGEVNDTVVFTIDTTLFSMVFYQGWNLITIPFQSTLTAETLGSNITGCSVVIMFNASSQTFLTHVMGVPWDNFPIEDGVGYFVYATTDSILTLQDVPIGSVTVPISPGWNVIGWYHDYTATAESLGDSISGSSVVIMLDAEIQTFLTHVVNTPWDNFTIRRGMGLFIYTTQSSIWYGEG